MFKILGSLLVLGFSQNLFAASATTPANLSDAEIAQVLVTLNEGEVDASKIAKSKAQNPEVKSFAKMMVDEHTKNMKETKTLAKDNGIKPADSELSKSMKEEAKQKGKDLKAHDKASFDKAYADGMVADHEKALATLDGMIAVVKDPELKGHLVKTRGHVEAHLGHAKDMASKIQ